MLNNEKQNITKDLNKESLDNKFEQNLDKDKNISLKFFILKKALTEERQKASLFEKENKTLKEENQKKDVIISELKDEIKKYHDAIGKKTSSNFFSELFQNINFSDIKNEFSIKKLTEENSGLKEKISNLQNELNLLKINNQNNLSLLSEQKKEFDNKVQIYEEKIKNYIKENETMKQKILEYEKRNITLEQTISALSSDRKIIEENVAKLKKEIKRKNETIDKIFREQEIIINNNTEYKLKINNLKNIINQYKKAIDNSTEIKEDYIFIGKIIPNTHYNNIININNEVNADMFLKIENKINDVNNKENYENIKIMFNFNKKNIKICVENKTPINIETNNIIDIVENLHIEGQIKIFFKIKENVCDYLCQFTKKEADYIIHFYNELKNNDHIDPALYAAYLGTQ